jgi:hypothetical protein
MDRSEELARTYLESLGLGTVVYEPDGGVPPDFALDDIGIEVRRLNQNYEGEAGYEGLESFQASVLRFVEKLLPTFGPPQGGQGWWVFYYFWRPLDRKAVKRGVAEVLAAFRSAPLPAGLHVRITPGFELDIRPASIPVAHYFMLGGYADRDAGGFVGSEIIRNLNICIAEKAVKIQPYQERYREWWLLLPDYIGPNLNAEERQDLAGHVNTGPFRRVVLIHPQVPTNALVFARTPDS